jgi:hypothetical protein
MRERFLPCFRNTIKDVGNNSLLLYLSVLYLTTGIIVLGSYQIFPEIRMQGFETFIAWYQILSGLISLASFIWINQKFSDFFRALSYWTIAAVGISGFVIFAYAQNYTISLFSLFGTVLLILNSHVGYKRYVNKNG